MFIFKYFSNPFQFQFQFVYLIFKPWKKKLSISLGGQLLPQTNATKFLGVHIDEHLTWKDHISYLCKQISKSIGMLFRARFYLSSKTKVTLLVYFSLIYPYIIYCNSTWSSTYVTNCYLLPPLFFNLYFFFTKSQIHGYSTRRVNNYRVHHCQTNLKKIDNSLPRS